MWDVWNESDNPNAGSYNSIEIKNKTAIVNKLLPQVFRWVRGENPAQPVTSGVWTCWFGGWHKDSTGKRTSTETIQIENSDIISFHMYGGPAGFENYALQLQSNGRPLICTEYLARGNVSTLFAILPLGKKYNIRYDKLGFCRWQRANQISLRSLDKTI